MATKSDPILRFHHGDFYLNGPVQRFCDNIKLQLNAESIKKYNFFYGKKFKFVIFTNKSTSGLEHNLQPATFLKIDAKLNFEPFCYK